MCTHTTQRIRLPIGLLRVQVQEAAYVAVHRSSSLVGSEGKLCYSVSPSCIDMLRITHLGRTLVGEACVQASNGRVDTSFFELERFDARKHPIRLKPHHPEPWPDAGGAYVASLPPAVAFLVLVPISRRVWISTVILDPAVEARIPVSGMGCIQT